MAAAESLRSMMAEGWHIIARVNMPFGGWHWVYIEGVTADGKIYMCDPAVDDRDLYAVYPDGVQGEYWALKGTNPPDMNFTPPITYEGSVKIEVTKLPDKLCYEQGEELDLTGGEVTISGVHPKKGPWEKEPCSLTEESSLFGISTWGFSGGEPGRYTIYVYTYTDYGYAETYFEVSVSYPAGEYCLYYSSAPLYSDEKCALPIMELPKGTSVEISECKGVYGKIKSDTADVWVNMEMFSAVREDEEERLPGDINGDGSIDNYDLAVLNEYISSPLPDGVSTLTSYELAAADINSDGKVDKKDVSGLLILIFDERS